MPKLPPVAILSVASALPLAEGGAVPEWLMVIPSGRSSGVDGRGPYNLTNPVQVAAHSMSVGQPLPFDYNHQTIFAAKNGSPSPAAGWIDKLEARDGALWARVDWTDAGRTAVASREYRFISPAFKHDLKTGEVLELVSVGLVNMPNLRELPALNSQNHFGDPMDQEALDTLAAALGLPAGSTLEQITAHGQDLRTKSQAPAGKVATQAPLTTGVPDPALFVPMAAFTELQGQVAAMAQASATNAAQTAVEDASRAGKLTPAMKDWALTYASRHLDGFKTWLAASPVIVTPGVILPNTQPNGGVASASGKDILAVCTNLGISEEAYKATASAGVVTKEI